MKFKLRNIFFEALLSYFPQLYRLPWVKNKYRLYILSEVEEVYKDLSLENLSFIKRMLSNDEFLYRRNYVLKDYARRGVRGTLQPWPFYIEKKKIKEIEDVSINVKKILDKLVLNLFQSSPQFVSDFYRIPIEDVKNYYLRGLNFIEDTIARGDYIDTKDGFKCIEINSSTNIGGWQGKIVGSIYSEEKILNDFKHFQKITSNSVDTIELIFRDTIALCERNLKGFNKTVNVIFLEYDKYIADYDSLYLKIVNNIYFDVLKKYNPEFKGEIFVTVKKEDLKVDESKLSYKGNEIQVIYNMNIDISLEMIGLVETQELILLNIPVTKLLGNKITMALLSDIETVTDKSVFTRQELKIINDIIPWTRIIKDGKVKKGSQSVDLITLLLDRKKDFVIKSGDGCGGTGVYIGRESNEHKWKKIIKLALSKGDWIVQEFTPSKSYIMQYGKFGFRKANAVWGFFVFNNNYRGNLIRLNPTSASAIINIKQGAHISHALHLSEKTSPSKKSIYEY